MKTILDEFHTTFLRAVRYAAGELRVVVVEGFRAAEPDDVKVGDHVIRGTYALAPSEQSRVVEIRFARPVAWEVVDESFTSGNDHEVREDDSALQVLTRSRYLDHIRAEHGWFEDMRGPGKHYRVWTENEVVEVVACEPPCVAVMGAKIEHPELLRADGLLKAGEVEGAFAAYRGVAEDAREDVRTRSSAYAGMGFVTRAVPAVSDQDESGFAYFSKALELDPENEDAHAGVVDGYGSAPDSHGDAEAMRRSWVFLVNRLDSLPEGWRNWVASLMRGGTGR